MNKILIICEGKTEYNFITQYTNVIKSDNFEVVTFRQNIIELYNIACEYIFDDIKPDNILDIIREKATNIKKEDKEKLNNKYTDIYLIFDFDLQIQMYNKDQLEKKDIYDYLKKINSIVNFFDNSTTIGQILINYPMMESIYDFKKQNNESYEKKIINIDNKLQQIKNYKRYIGANNLKFSESKMLKNDFNHLAAINLKKANKIVFGIYEKPSIDKFYEDLTQTAIFKKQKSKIMKKDNPFLYVLNTTFFIDVDQFGRILYFNKDSDRLYDDDIIIERFTSLK